MSSRFVQDLGVDIVESLPNNMYLTQTTRDTSVFGEEHVETKDLVKFSLSVLYRLADRELREEQEEVNSTTFAGRPPAFDDIAKAKLYILVNDDTQRNAKVVF